MAAEPHRGGVLRLTAAAAAGTIDPQVNYRAQFAQLFNVTNDGLVAFRKADGQAGYELVPDLAEAMPEVRDGGRTYVFRLRRGVRFSTGREVEVADVAASFRRLFLVRGPNAASWYAIIRGGDACLAAPGRCSLADGMVTDAASRTVTFHLTHPSGEFLDQIALPGAAVLPAETPARDLGVTPAAATGPYMFASYAPTRGLRLVRNPYFHVWNEAAQPDGYVDEIDYRFGQEEQAEVTEVENGQQDWMYDWKPLDRLAEIGARYPGLAHISPLHAYYYLALNVNLPPFDVLAARRAVGFAIDRRAAVDLYGGPSLGTPFCQLIPAGMPGYVPYCPYSRPPGPRWVAPDLARARALVRQSGTAGQSVTLITSDWAVDRAIGTYLQSVLNDIGYRASLRSLSSNISIIYMQNSNNRVQIGLTTALEDYPAPSDDLYTSFACSAFHPGSDASMNIAGFCDRAIDARMEAALALQASDWGAAATLWAALDHDLTDQAAYLTLFQMNFLDIVSARLGNYRFSPLTHMILSSVWVR